LKVKVEVGLNFLNYIFNSTFGFVHILFRVFTVKKNIYIVGVT